MNQQSNPSVKDNLVSLHEHEKALREQSLAIIASHAALADHLNPVREAMNVIYAFTQEHVHNSDDELTKQFLGIRLFNAAAVSIKLALSGYYQNAFVHVRDIKIVMRNGESLDAGLALRD